MLVKHRVMNAEDYNNSGIDNDHNQSGQKEWYETLWGLALITIGLNVISNFIYDKGRERLRLSDKSKQKLRDIDFLQTYEGKTERQAEDLVNAEYEKVDKEIT